jgi:hypothetical protein
MTFVPTAFSRKTKAIAAGVAITAVAAGGVGVAQAVGSKSPSNAVTVGKGIDQFGLTKGQIGGKDSTFRYTKGFICDTAVKSLASSGCEAGEDAKNSPNGTIDPLYVTVPLGFSPARQECPADLACVDHPGTIDLSRLASALLPLYKGMSVKDLAKALHNVALPGHDHLITTKAGGKAEYWDVNVIGVLDPQVYAAIKKNGSFAYVQKLIDAKSKAVTGIIPTNAFLFFSAK